MTTRSITYLLHQYRKPVIGEANIRSHRNNMKMYRKQEQYAILDNLTARLHLTPQQKNTVKALIKQLPSLRICSKNYPQETIILALCIYSQKTHNKAHKLGRIDNNKICKEYNLTLLTYTNIVTNLLNYYMNPENHLTLY